MTLVRASGGLPDALLRVGFGAIVTVALTSCGSELGATAVSAAPASPSPAVAQTEARTTAVPSTAATEPAVVPRALVGDWSSAEGNAEIVYRFLADGRFRSVQILNQVRPGGLFEFRVVQEGTFEVTADRLVLRPTSALKSVTDPDEPQRSYTDRPASRDPRTFTWAVVGSTLRLRDADGLVVTYSRP